MKEFSILTNLMGISAETASLFLAEIRDISAFDNYKEIEKFAGYNLRLTQSGKHIGYRRISHLGNTRLRWVLYRMTEETIKIAFHKFEADIAIKQSESRFRKIIEKNKDGIAIIGKDGKILFVNKAFEFLFETEKTELLDQQFEYTITPDELTEIEIETKPGNKRIAEMHSVEIEWEKQKAFLTTLRDVTKRKQTK